jgi:DNA-binding CsgD family transcriptional regulator
MKHRGMTKLRTPLDAATAVLQNPALPVGDDERFVGFGVMGFPFASGHYLALRCRARWPYLTVRILSQVGGLQPVAQLAGNHHECLNGSGYPRGLSGAALGVPDRILAAAVGYQSACEPRPYRQELSPTAAARRLPERVHAGALDSAAVEVVLRAAGHRTERPKLRPDGLTPREIDVLRLVARGASNKEIAESLVISDKTARNHIERTYAKIGVSNRIGASMYALRHGLVNPAST